jgi:hypothetical protein
MNSISQPDTNRQRKPDPRAVLDVKKRTKICGLLALGYSRRMAAEYVGCDPSTITRTAQRDESFREQLAGAQADADVDCLKLIRRTADQEKYWRAAAWILERRNPEEFGRRAPNMFTGEQVMKILQRALCAVMPAVPLDKVEEVMGEFEEELQDVADKARLPLPEYYPPEYKDDVPPDGEKQAAAPVRVPIVSPPAEKPQPDMPPSPLPAKFVAALETGGRRVSCLDEFVQREPIPTAVRNGRRQVVGVK